MSRPSDLTVYLALFLMALFGALAATAYIKSLLDSTYHPEPTLTAIATAIVGACVTHLIIRGRRNGNGNGNNRGNR